MADTEKTKKRKRAWIAANHEHVREYSRKQWFKVKYGITFDERDKMLQEQGNACAACGATEPGNKKGWATDHCHTSKIVRGILCHHCNVGLGNARDSVETLNKWIAYLERHQSNPLR